MPLTNTHVGYIMQIPRGGMEDAIWVNAVILIRRHRERKASARA